ncbi:DUF4625 domain-containing protein [Dyadobacter tibetensis]|uniref:DUF4625 domain-containing protein n=1 Tax=Dyadobacter tibetensis TaxID=1211851 RepID=UPI0004726948|nr:DUF4625 domain-containing protein [Dyadobacter tibetensis]
MLNILQKICACLAIGLLVTGCEKNIPDIDTVYPVIETDGTNSFPVQCSRVKRGEPFVFKATFSDNRQLGAFSLDIHHNFDHHTHSTEVSNCQTDKVKVPKNPFLFIKSFDIPANLTRFEASQQIDIPADIDPGDYHFLIRLTDQEGWQTIKGISFKIE